MTGASGATAPIRTSARRNCDSTSPTACSTSSLPATRKRACSFTRSPRGIRTIACRPSNQGLKLALDEIAVLEAWIAAGAEWQDHWSFVQPVRPQPPLIAGSSWARNPIDQFVQSRFRAAGFKPAETESRERLLRRVTLDLTGLPPTIESLDRFLASTSPDAYEREVDRLLASPAYGERMAWEWLDVARYSDTNGFQHDATRTMWPWRDWVVQALNENMPYDRFTVWQIAGDLLPTPTIEQRLATAFLRNHMINGEGGRIPEESRVEYIFDQVETVATTWTGADIQLLPLPRP